MADTATLTFDPGAGNTYEMGSVYVSSATAGNKVIIASGTVKPQHYGDNYNQNGDFNAAEVDIENGGLLLLDGYSDLLGWNDFTAPIRVKTGGILEIARRETMTHTLYLDGGKLKLSGLDVLVQHTDKGVEVYISHRRSV